jgi:hypothetical protein
MPVRERSVLRHVVALLTCLAMLHLTLVSGELSACTTHGAMDMPGVSTSMAGMHGHAPMTAMAAMHGVALDAPASSEQAAPMHSACCAAAAPCGLLAVVGGRSHPAAIPQADAVAHGEPGALRLSIGSAPEPPPPRA